MIILLSFTFLFCTLAYYSHDEAKKEDDKRDKKVLLEDKKIYSILGLLCGLAAIASLFGGK